LLDDVDNLLHCLDMARLHADVAAGTTAITIALNGHAFELKVGTHVFLTYTDAFAAAQ
jgi:hypothetical protein